MSQKSDVSDSQIISSQLLTPGSLVAVTRPCLQLVSSQLINRHPLNLNPVGAVEKRLGILHSQSVPPNVAQNK